MQSRLRASGLSDIADKLDAAFVSISPTAFVCSSAPICCSSAGSRIASARSGTARRTFYNYNIRIEATNVCVASCLFCSFARLKPGDADAYTMSLDEAWDKLRRRADQPLTEVHVVNGLHPGSAVRATTRSCCAASSASGRTSI